MCRNDPPVVEISGKSDDLNSGDYFSTNNQTRIISMQGSDNNMPGKRKRKILANSGKNLVLSPNCSWHCRTIITTICTDKKSCALKQKKVGAFTCDIKR